MTFNNSAWAIDHAATTAALARRATYASTSGNEGVIAAADLKVAPLDVPGVGVKIGAGTALVLNRYQTTVSETYTVLNSGDHTITSDQMPAASPAAQSYLVAITVGDPEFSQVGHPWMGSDDPPAGEEDTFSYVRPWLIACPANTTSAAALNLPYPAYALARIDVPANTTTITAAMIHDLRHLANPRRSEEMLTAAESASANLTGTAMHQFPAGAHWAVNVPDWAVTAKILGFVEGVQFTAAAQGSFEVLFTDGGAAESTQFNFSAPTSGTDVFSVNLGGTISVPAAYRGTQRTMAVYAQLANTSMNNHANQSQWTSSTVRVLFEEAVI